MLLIFHPIKHFYVYFIQSNTDIYISANQTLSLHIFQPITLGGDENPHLQLPAPHKQYLISPPASPPVDWEPCFEKKPVINYELLAALAQLAPGKLSTSSFISFAGTLGGIFFYGTSTYFMSF